VSSILDRLGEARFLSSIDLREAYQNEDEKERGGKGILQCENGIIYGSSLGHTKF
jgi:hypothetical protein